MPARDVDSHETAAQSINPTELLDLFRAPGDALRRRTNAASFRPFWPLLPMRTLAS